MIKQRNFIIYWWYYWKKSIRRERKFWGFWQWSFLSNGTTSSGRGETKWFFDILLEWGWIARLSDILEFEEVYDDDIGQHKIGWIIYKCIPNSQPQCQLTTGRRRQSLCMRWNGWKKDETQIGGSPRNTMSVCVHIHVQTKSMYKHTPKNTKKRQINGYLSIKHRECVIMCGSQTSRKLWLQLRHHTDMMCATSEFAQTTLCPPLDPPICPGDTGLRPNKHCVHRWIQSLTVIRNTNHQNQNAPRIVPFSFFYCFVFAFLSFSFVF